MKKIFSFLLIILIFSCSSAPKYHSFDDALENGIQKIENDLSNGSKVAILDFKSDNQNLSSYIIEELYDKLINGGKFTVMERSRIATIALEVGYQLSGEVDDREIINIGHQLGADYVVTGQITFSGEAYRLRVFAIDIEKGIRVASSSLNINTNDRQINYLLSSRANENTQAVKAANANTDTRNEEILLDTIQDLLKNIPRNSRILITGIVGSNELRAEYVQSIITNEARNMVIITEEGRASTITMLEKQNSGEYWVSDDEYIPIGSMIGANIIVTGGIFGTRDTRRIIFRALNVETRQIMSVSSALFSQNNTEYINDVEALIHRINDRLQRNIRNDSSITVINEIGTNRNADFILDMIENSLFHLSKYKIATNNLEIINKELLFQRSGHISDETTVNIGRFLGVQYAVRIDTVSSRIRIRVQDVMNGNTIIEETI
jgi:TolB-like protein